MLIEPKPLICSSCGGRIDRRTMKCPYCDTQYAVPGSDVRIEVREAGIHTVRCQAEVDDELVVCSPERAMEYTLKQMRQQIADGLLAYMQISTKEDPMMCRRIIRGEVRVVIPEFWD